MGVVEHAPDTSITLFNAEACRLLGMTPDQMTGRQARDPAWRFLDENGRMLPVERYPVVRVLADGQPLQGMVAAIVPHAGSERTWVHVNAFPETDAAGAVQRVVVVFIDITAQRLAQSLREARDMAQYANQAKSHFMSRMSHELRTPLNAVLGFSQLLEMDATVRATPPIASQVRLIRGAGEHLLSLVNDLLDIARIESGEMALRLVDLELGPVVHECVAMVRPLATAAAQPVRIRVEPRGPVWARAERARLRQVLVNLLTNAIKYNRPGGEVTVTLLEADDRAGIRVRDTGLGLTPLQLAGLFQPFNRLGAEARGIEGTGLGLVISRELAERMGGSLVAESTPEVGSAFTLWLPRGPGLPPVYSSRSVDTAPPLPAPVEGQAPLVCVCIEDNAANAEFLSRALALRPTVRLHLATAGLPGIELVRQQRPHLLLLDLNLPDIDGHEVLRRLREQGLAEGLRCVAVTAWATPQDLQAARDAGFDAVLAKPFEVGRLLDVVDEVIVAALEL